MKKNNKISDRELIETLASAHLLSPKELTKILIRFGLITLFKDLQIWGDLASYNEYLAQLNSEPLPNAGDYPITTSKDIANKEALRLKNARIAGNKFYHKNKDTINADCRKKYAEDKEARRIYNREYYAANRERILELDKVARKRQKDA